MKRLILVLLTLLTYVLLSGCNSIQITGDTSLFVGQKVHVVLRNGDDLVPNGLKLIDGRNRGYDTSTLDDYQFISPSEEVFRVPAIVATGEGELQVSHAGGGTYSVYVSLHRAIAYADQQGAVHVMDMDEPTSELKKISFGQQTEAIGTSDVSYAFPIYSTNVGQVAVVSMESGEPEAIHVKALRLTSQQQLLVYDVALNWTQKRAFAATDQGLVRLIPSGDSLTLEDFELHGKALRVLVDNRGVDKLYMASLMVESGEIVPYVHYEGEDAWQAVTSISGGEIVDAALLYPSLFVIVRTSDQRYVYYYDLTDHDSPPDDITSYLQEGEYSCADPSAVRLGGDVQNTWSAILCGSRIYVTRNSTNSYLDVTSVDLPEVGNAIARGERDRLYVLLANGEIGYINMSSGALAYTKLSDSYIRVSNIWIQH